MKIYKCEKCGQDCVKMIWGVENASEKIGDGMIVICDDCFNNFHPDKFPEVRDRAIKEPLIKSPK